MVLAFVVGLQWQLQPHRPVVLHVWSAFTSGIRAAKVCILQKACAFLSIKTFFKTDGLFTRILPAFVMTKFAGSLFYELRA
jgi:hypothetical protein